MKATHEDLKQWFNNKSYLNIEGSTVSKILKTFVISTEVNKDLTEIKRNRTAKYPQLKSALYEWQLRYENIAIIIDVILNEKAKRFAQNLKISENEFSFSMGWVSRFKKRHGIKLHNTQRESASVDIDLVNQELPKLKQVINQFDLENVYNFDETALFYRLEPDSTLATKRISGR
jgi:hypothetical protein